MKKKFKSESTKKIIFEIFSIVLAVLIALGVNEIRNDYENNNLAETAVENIKKEINHNYNSLKTHLIEQDSTLVIFDEAKKYYAKKNELPEKFKFRVEHQVLTTTAWESAKITQAVKFFNYQTVESLSAIYELIEIYKRQTASEIQQLGSIEYFAASTEDLLDVNLYNLKMIMNVEKTIITNMEEFLSNNQNDD